MMERLTHQRNSGIKTGYWSPNKKEELIERLAAYKNTGLTPEDVERVNDFERSETGKLLKVLGEERKKHRWIPVEEQLPPICETVLLTVPVNRGMSHGYGSLDIGFLCDGHAKEFYGADGRYKFAEVFAWMPLPEPYRPEED